LDHRRTKPTGTLTFQNAHQTPKPLRQPLASAVSSLCALAKEASAKLPQEFAKLFIALTVNLSNTLRICVTYNERARSSRCVLENASLRLPLLQKSLERLAQHLHPVSTMLTAGSFPSTLHFRHGYRFHWHKR
jgi:hypothetical protein